MIPGARDFAAPSQERARLAPNLASSAERGIAQFAFGAWGGLSSDTLETSAAPWKLTTAALALQETRGDVAAVAEVDLAALFQRFGFPSPGGFGNWPDSLPAPRIDTPLGLNTGTALKTWPPIGAEIGNIGCAACHSSVMYRGDGTPNPSRVWLGAPNGSINLEAYTQALFTALRDHSEPDALMQTVATLYPETDWRERLTLRWFVLPVLRDEIAERDAKWGRLLPFRASLAGATNGLDSLKNRLGLIPDGEVLTESIFNSVPDLGGRLWRTKLLNSGSYAIPGADHARPIRAEDITEDHRRGLAGIIAYFTVPSMGVTPEVAEAHIEDALDVTAWMALYAPQPFPGEIDAALAARGGAIYANACASCHGDYDDAEPPQLISFPNWEGDIGTDPARADLLTQEVSGTVNASLFGRYIAARTVEGYTAPPLTGLWASAPYFHNGSVPTLWHLLHPQTRPERFMVGGHRLDLDRVGIDLDPPADYVPWAAEVEVDTRAFGLSRGGHEASIAPLDEADKQALLEFLKTL